ncbi:MAG: transposase [Candidatus Obscuribacter sp.]|nr:transposase [Candidatus Obscuribacter sp.]
MVAADPEKTGETVKTSMARVEIVVRADGAFTDNELYKWMDENRVRYVLGMKDNHSLFVKTKQFRAKAQSKFKRKYEEPRYLGKSGKKGKEQKAERDIVNVRQGQAPAGKTRIRTPAGAGVWRNQLRSPFMGPGAKSNCQV